MTVRLVIGRTLTVLAEEPQASKITEEAKRRGLSVERLPPEHYGDDNASASTRPFMLRAH